MLLERLRIVAERLGLVKRAEAPTSTPSTPSAAPPPPVAPSAAPPPPVAPSAVPPPPVTPSVVPPEAARSRGAASPPPESPPSPDFAPFARALGIEAPVAPPPVPEADEEEDARLAELILERFSAAKPEPTSFPAVALQVLNLVASSRTEVAELARIIARDPALSAGVLSVANSAYHRGLMEVETVRDAITRLGLEEVARVVAAVSARTLFSARHRAEQAAHGQRWSALFAKAVTVGSAAAAAALRQPAARADRVYLGGLLHDVGKSLALRALAGLVMDAKAPEPDTERLERVLDRVHVEVGAEAHQAWGLPQYLTVLCVRHHDPVVPPHPDFVDLHLVRLTSALADVGEARFAARAAAEIAQSAEALRLGPHAVRALSADLRQAMERTASISAAGKR